jgi:hypothetical protein
MAVTVRRQQLLNYLVSAGEERGRERHPYRTGSAQVDHKLEALWLFYRQLTRRLAV